MKKKFISAFMECAHTFAKLSSAKRAQVGCIIVKDKRILCSGYVGSPPGFPHCTEAGHLMKKVIDDDGTQKQHCMRTIHAEQNAICQAAKYGIPLENTILYCSMEPCRVCAMLIISVGVKKVVAKRKYHAARETRELFKEAGIELIVLNNETVKYDKQ